MDNFNYYNPNNPYVYGNPYQANFYGTVYQQDNWQPPSMDSTLTPDELKILKSSKPDDQLFNLNIDQKDVLRAICNHKEGGRDVVQPMQDGSGLVWCPICGAKWDPTEASREEVEQAINTLYNHMQHDTWYGFYPINVGREYFAMLPLLEKFPDLYKYGADNVNRLLYQGRFSAANNASIHYQYDQLFNRNRMVNPNMYGGYGYGAPSYQPQPGYVNPYGAMNQPVGTPANPNVNPMQATNVGGQPQATQQQAPAPNQAYGAPPVPPAVPYGLIYGYGPTGYAAPPAPQPGYVTPPQQPYAPNFAPPQQAQAPAQAPQGQPAANAAPQQAQAPAQADQQQTTNVKIDL